MLKHQGEPDDLSALDFETVDTEMIIDEAKEEQRQATEEIASILVDIETKVGVEIVAIKAEIAAAEGGEDTNEGTDGQTIIALIDHPSEQVQFFFFSKS